MPGFWNSTPAEHNSYTYDLRSLDGTVTPAYVWHYGGTELRNDDHLATTGDGAISTTDIPGFVAKLLTSP